MNLATLALTGALAAQTTAPLQFRDGRPNSLTIQANFIYGSGGTTVDAWVQTSLDGGATWTDIANFHFATTSARKIINLSALTPETTQVTPTDGTMASNTAQDGIIGTLLRVKWTSVGTYAGNTSLAIDVQGGTRLTPQS